MKIVSIVGARPQFIKEAVINRLIKNDLSLNEVIVHTGQHYDKNMSASFFTELEIAQPDYNLEVGSGTHAMQTALILERVDEVFVKENPDWVLVYGDTNSTLAGALAASKRHIKLAHVEAGLRSYNRKMPEEINRITTDRISYILFAPSQNAVDILRNEGLSKYTYYSGDVMFDSVLHYRELAAQKYNFEGIISIDDYYLATVHRQENTDNIARLQNIFDAFSELDFPVVLPLHPRTKKTINSINYNDNIILIEPVSYLKMLLLLKNCKKVLTDSGGLQKEAYFLQKPCITLRDETEWIETLENNWNFVVGTDKQLILEKTLINDFGKQKKHYGDGKAGEKILSIIKNYNDN